MRVVIHKEGFAIEAFTFFIEIFVKTKREFFSVFKLRKWKRELCYVRRKWKMKKVEKSENNKSDYVQMEWVEKKELEEVVI